jgi:hypothetical protein
LQREESDRPLHDRYNIYEEDSPHPAVEWVRSMGRFVLWGRIEVRKDSLWGTTCREDGVNGPRPQGYDGHGG